MTEEEKQALEERYAIAAHAVQSGTAQFMHLTDAHSPKHMRTGVNILFAQDAALAQILIAKGIITQEEYMVFIVEAMENEVKSMEAQLSEIMGAKITLA